MHNLQTVFNFEVKRTLKKKSFWIMALSFPLLMGMVFGIVFYSNKATEDAANQMEKQQFSIAVKDDSGLIKETLVSALGASRIDDKDAGVEKVKSGQLDAFYYYPSDLTKGAEVYGKDVGIFNNGRYDAVSRVLLSQSVNESVDANTKAALTGSVTLIDKTYKDGVESNPIMQMIAPGAFLVLFYFLIAMFGNQALASTTEEKENRVIEMILTTIQARTLIIGKILSLIVLAVIQGALLITPVIIAYVFLHNQLSLPSIDLSNIPLDLARIATAFVIFATSFMLFIGLLVTVGAATPTAKDAAQFFGIVMMLIFVPLYAAPLFISTPDQIIVKVLSYFPFTSPIPLLLRNATGTITWPEIAIGISILLITTFVMVRVAVRTFRFGALEYSRKLSPKEIFSRH